MDALHASSFADYIRIVTTFQQMAIAEWRDADHPLFLFRGTRNEDAIKKNSQLVASIEGFRKPDASIHLGRDMFIAFKDKCQFPHSYSDWDILSFARHFALPCRMLDWSSNSLVALWFATHEKSADDVSKPVENDISCAVWLLKTMLADYENINKDEQPFPVAYGKTGIFKPPELESRIKNQNSFMMRQVYEYKEGKGRTRRAIDMEIKPVDKNPVFKERLWKIDVSGWDYASLDKELGQYGLTDDFLFQTDPYIDSSRIKSMVDSVMQDFSKYSARCPN